MQHIPQQRLAHQTLGVQRLAVRSEDYWEYKPEQRVQTCDGFPGTVTAVLDGPHPGTEEYQVTLDGGMGGGAYTASQLSPAPTVTAAAGTAGADYPELAQVLVDRPDPALHHVYASSKPPWVKDDDSDQDDSDDDSDDDDDDGSGKGDKDPDDDGDDDSGKDSDSDDDSDDDSDKDDDDSDNAPPWAKKKASLFDSLIRTAAPDGDHSDDAPEWSDGRFNTKTGHTYYSVTEPNAVTLRTHEGRMGGYISWGDQDVIANVKVMEQHQRRGVATELLRRAREIRPGLQHDHGRLSNDAKAWLKGIGERTANQQDGGDLPSLFDSLIRTAALDSDFRFHVTSAWRDVVAKAKRIRSEGGVRVTLASEGVFFAEVKGDHHVYEAGLQRLPGRMAAQSWSCGCKWGAYHWGADDDFSRFAGRMCSHALALQYEAQSRGMFGREVNVDEDRPTWVPRKVVIRYDIDSGQNQLVRSSSMKTARSWDDPEPSMWDMDGDGDHDYEDQRRATSEGWDNVHSSLGDIHRGVNVHLRPEDHDIVHDQSRPMHERAQHLLKALPHSELAHGNTGLGTHWTDNDGVAESFGEMDSSPNRHGWHPTSVVFHAEKPDRDAIDEAPDESKGEIYGYHDHGESEVPLRPGAGVHLKGISWKNMNTPDEDFQTVKGDGLFDHFWEHQRHEFPGGHSHTASLQQAPLQALARAAVAAGEDREEVMLALAVAGVTASSWDGEDEDEDDGDHECENCGEDTRSPHHSEAHRDWESQQVWHTPWEDGPYHEMADTVHRGMSVELPKDVHKVVHDDDRPMHERAKALVDHLTGEKKNIGTYWSDRQQTSREYASRTPTGSGNDYTPVVFHARKPEMHHIMTDPEDLEYHGVYSFNHTNGDGEQTNREVPLQHGAPVHLTGVSWSKPTYGKEHHAGFVRHDFDTPQKHEASVNSPFGEPSSGTAYQMPHAPGATKPRRSSDNPASSGPFIGADPVGWQSELPTGSLDDRLGAADHSLFEPGGTEAELHEEPEGALPATDGVSIPSDDEALTPSMTASLSKRALKDFTIAEQQALINEGEGVRAANLDRLQIEGTHYAELEGVLAAADDDTTWMA